MPLYEYECEACGERFELIRKFSDSSVDVCTLCGKGPVKRLFSSPAIQFKGSGFYITDYPKKGEGSKAEGAKGEDSKGEKPAGKSDAGASETPKGDRKSDAKSATDKPVSSPATPAKSSGAAKD
jgi:putative FmdB family regulatory protein